MKWPNKKEERYEDGLKPLTAGKDWHFKNPNTLRFFKVGSFGNNVDAEHHPNRTLEHEAKAKTEPNGKQGAPAAANE